MKPGIYPDMPEAEYHGDPVPDGSLSHSGAKVILGKSPQHYRHRVDHGGGETAALLFGRAIHARILGTGAEIVVYGDNLRTNGAKEKRAAALAAGLTPVSTGEAEVLDAMAEAFLAHPYARKLIERPGAPEQSLFTIDEETGLWRRSRMDFMPAIDGPGRPVVVDYKSAADADEWRFGKASATYDYPGQADWYLSDYASVGGDPEAAFVFIAQEKEPPYAVAVYEVMADDLAAGRAYNRAAIRRYAECAAAGDWPGYTDAEIKPLRVPAWYRDNAPTDEGDAA